MTRALQQVLGDDPMSQTPGEFPRRRSRLGCCLCMGDMSCGSQGVSWTKHHTLHITHGGCS